MEKTKCVTLQKKPEIKAIINELRKRIEVYGCNCSERMVDLFKRAIKKKKI